MTDWIAGLTNKGLKNFKHSPRRNLKFFTGAKIELHVSPCVTCMAIIKKFWPVFADPADAGRQAAVAAIADKTLDINVFLTDILKIRPGEPDFSGKRRVTVHDPYHLKRSFWIAAQPRMVARLNPEVELLEMKDADVCCGCGGSFTLLHYDIAAKLGRHKRDHIVATGAGTVVTGCPACMLQITDMLSKAGDRVAVRHPVELYAESLG